MVGQHPPEKTQSKILPTNDFEGNVTAEGKSLVLGYGFKVTTFHSQEVHCDRYVKRPNVGGETHFTMVKDVCGPEEERDLGVCL